MTRETNKFTSLPPSLSLDQSCPMLWNNTIMLIQPLHDPFHLTAHDTHKLCQITSYGCMVGACTIIYY